MTEHDKIQVEPQAAQYYKDLPKAERRALRKEFEFGTKQGIRSIVLCCILAAIVVATAIIAIIGTVNENTFLWVVSIPTSLTTIIIAIYAESLFEMWLKYEKNIIFKK